MRALYAEDSEDWIEIVRSWMRRWGHTVDIVRNGRELLDKLKTETYDLVMTDMEMPVMDGFQALLAIRDDPRLKDLPVIVLSSTDSAAFPAMVVAEGGVFVPKGELTDLLPPTFEKLGLT